MSAFKKAAFGAASVIAISLAVSAAQAAGQPAGEAAGQAANRGGGDEIVVTALKRETTLQETPVAVSVIGGGDLKASQIRDVMGLSLLAPSLDVSQFANSSATQFSIRGVGTSPFNPGLEPSVGVFVDGVYRSRQGSSINDFPVVERIEVLRGPQSTIYGKNTPAGVISILTKKPEHEIGADAAVTYGNYGNVIMKGTLTGPIGEKAAFRISGNTNHRDGFIRNVTTGQDVNDRDRWAVRGQLLLDPTDNLSVRIIGDYSELNEACCAAPFFLNNPVNAFVMGSLGANILPATPFERKVAFDGNLLTEQKLWGFSGEADLALGWADLTSITAYRSADEVNDIDTDFVDIPLAPINQNIEKYTTFTQELRLTSTGDGKFHWMIGGYFFDQDLTHDRISTYGPSLRQFGDGVSGGAITTLESILGVFRGVAPGSYLATGDGLQKEFFSQADQSISVFGNMDYDLTDRLTVSGGVRWTTEKKDVTSNVVINDAFSALDLQNIPELAFLSIPVNAFAGLSPFQFYPPFTNFTDSRRENNVSYMARANYELTQSLNVYAGISTGWKAGGFNLSTGSTASQRDFDPEDTRSIEIGAKGQFLDGALTANVALFHEKIDGFQASVFNGANFDLANAGGRKIKGFEVDSTFTPVDNIVLTAAATYLDARFSSFERASCVNSALLPTPVPPGLQSCDPTNAAAFTGVQDLSGKDDIGVPKWSASSTATWIIPLGVLEGFVRGEAQYSSNINLGGDQAPGKERGSFTLFNASVGISNADQGWALTVWGKNLTDEKYAQGIFDSVAQPGSLNGYPNDPRTYGVTLRLSY